MADRMIAATKIIEIARLNGGTSRAMAQQLLTHVQAQNDFESGQIANALRALIAILTEAGG